MGNHGRKKWISVSPWAVFLYVWAPSVSPPRDKTPCEDRDVPETATAVYTWRRQRTFPNHSCDISGAVLLHFRARVVTFAGPVFVHVRARGCTFPGPCCHISEPVLSHFRGRVVTFPRPCCHISGGRHCTFPEVKCTMKV